MRLSLAATFLALAFSSSIQAQNFNIDFGLTAQAAPASTYGGVPGQVGHWNKFTTVDISTRLYDLSDVPTNAFFKVGGTPLSLAGVSSPDANEQLLMSDGFRQFNTQVVEGTGLQAGYYDLTVYCWSGPGYAVPTVWVGGGSTEPFAMSNTNGAWPGGQKWAETYVTLRMYTNGNFYVSLSAPQGQSTVLSGMQLVKAPTPGAAALLGIAGLGVLRRRR